VHVTDWQKSEPHKLLQGNGKINLSVVCKSIIISQRLLDIIQIVYYKHRMAVQHRRQCLAWLSLIRITNHTYSGTKAVPTRWNSEIENKLHSIEPRVNMLRLPRQEIIIHRLRIGHTYLTHGHLLRGETPPRCLACQVDLTVEHVLIASWCFLKKLIFFVLLWPPCLNCFRLSLHVQ